MICVCVCVCRGLFVCRPMLYARMYTYTHIAYTHTYTRMQAHTQRMIEWCRKLKQGAIASWQLLGSNWREAFDERRCAFKFCCCCCCFPHQQMWCYSSLHGRLTAEYDSQIDIVHKDSCWRRELPRILIDSCKTHLPRFLVRKLTLILVIRIGLLFMRWLALIMVIMDVIFIISLHFKCS